MRVLLDNGIFSHAEFAKPDVQRRTVRFGNHTEVVIALNKEALVCEREGNLPGWNCPSARC
jgi:hypothetical protein